MTTSSSMAAQAIRGILFDALGTVVTLEPPAPRLREELRARLGADVSPEAATAAFAAEIGFYLEHHLEARDPASLDRLRDRCAAVLAGALGLPGLDGPAVRPAMLAALRFTAHPDAAPALAELRGAGLRVVVASNWDPSLPEALEQAGIARLFDGVVTSGAVGAAKPDVRLFAAALAEAGVEAGAAVHVGDSVAKDIEGALAAGVTPVFVDRAGEHPSLPPGVRAIRSLGELPSLISALA